VGFEDTNFFAPSLKEGSFASSTEVQYKKIMSKAKVLSQSTKKEPSTPPLQPKEKPAESTKKPVDPVKKSTDPVKKPADPVKKPTDPVKKPVEPAKKSVEPLPKKPTEHVKKSEKQTTEPVKKSEKQTTKKSEKQNAKTPKPTEKEKPKQKKAPKPEDSSDEQLPDIITEPLSAEDPLVNEINIPVDKKKVQKVIRSKKNATTKQPQIWEHEWFQPVAAVIGVVVLVALGYSLVLS